MINILRPQWKHHIECGKHSGFHRCCILWFLTVKHWAESVEWMTREKISESETIEELNRLSQEMKIDWTYDSNSDIYTFYKIKPIINKYFLETHKQIYYIRCPICRLLDRRVDVKRCDCEFTCGE